MSELTPQTGTEQSIAAGLQATDTRKQSLQRKFQKKSDAELLTTLREFQQQRVTGMDYDELAAEIRNRRERATYRNSERGNGQRFVAKYGENLHYSPESRKWYEWDGKHWLQDRILSVSAQMKSLADDMLLQATMMPESAERNAFVKWAMRSESANIVHNSLTMAQSEDGIPILMEEFDSDIYLLNCNNGTIDLETGEFREYQRDDLLTKISPVDYDPDAECPRWEQFLREIMPNEETIAFIQRAVGYSLTGFTGEQCFFLPWGSGANGKSTFLKVLQHVFGGYSMQSDWQTFSVSKSGGMQIRNDVARLNGARFVCAIESEKTVHLAESLIKALTGGDKITARFLYQESFEFQPQLKLWLATNHKPIVEGTDLAVWRRIRLIPFTVTIPPEQRDIHLEDKLKAEASGILNWALEGLRLYQCDGLGECQEVTEATANYRADSDVIQQFLNERCTVGNDGEVGSAMLYQAYRNFVGMGGEDFLNEREFKAALTERGFASVRTSQRKDKPAGIYWHGLTLNAMHGDEVIQL